MGCGKREKTPLGVFPLPASRMNSPFTTFMETKKIPQNRTSKMSVHSLWEIAAMPDTEQEEMDRLFCYDPKGDTIKYLPKNYAIQLGAIRTPQRLLGWILQLGQKPWMTNDVLCEFVERVCGLNGWNPYQD